jgi:hypothetical protein
MRSLLGTIIERKIGGDHESPAIPGARPSRGQGRKRDPPGTMPNPPKFENPMTPHGNNTIIWVRTLTFDRDSRIDDTRAAGLLPLRIGSNYVIALEVVFMLEFLARRYIYLAA